MFRSLALMSSISVLGALATFFYQTVGTHIMSVYDYGAFSRWLTDISYISLLFVLGLDSSLLYHARLGEKIESNNIKNLLIYTFIYAVSLAVIVVFNLEPFYHISLFTTIYLFAILGGIQAFFQFRERFTIFNFIAISRPVLVLLVFLLIMFRNDILSYKTIVVVYTATCALLTIVVVWIYLQNAEPIKPKNIFSYKYYTYGLKSILNKILALLLYSSSIYIINYLGGFEGVAFFFVASSISKMIWVVPDAAGNLLFPKFLKAKTEKENVRVIEDMIFYGQIILIITILSILLFLLLGKIFLNLFYQESYSKAFIPTLILLIGNQGMVWYKLLSRYFASKNYWRPLYVSLLLSTSVSVGLNFILIPIWGIIGSAIAVATSFWICGITISLFLRGSLIGFLNPYPAVMFFGSKLKIIISKHI